METWGKYKERIIEEVTSVQEYKEVSQEEFNETVLCYMATALKNPSLPSWDDFRNQVFIEGSEATRYSIEVNYRTTLKDSQEGFAKVCLGYVSAAMKAQGYHVKLVLSEKPLRILISTRNWDDGEWVGMVTYNPQHACFVLSKGFYNRERKTVAVQGSEKCKGDSAAEIVGDVRNLMHRLKNTPDRHQEKLKPVPLKRGPKG